MSSFGVTNNNDNLLRSLILKVDELTKIVSDIDNDEEPKTFKQLRALVIGMAKNEVQRFKDDKDLNAVIFKLADDIKNIQTKLQIND